MKKSNAIYWVENTFQGYRIHGIVGNVYYISCSKKQAIAEYLKKCKA